MLPDRYNKKNLFRLINNPKMLLDEVNHLTAPVQKRLINKKFYLSNNNYYPPIDVIEQDWDNLIILDACRFDFFADQFEHSGELNGVLSAGSSSWEFMNKNFVDREIYDTIYITANPNVDRIPSGTFYDVKNILDRWDSEIEVVHPKDVLDATIKVHDLNPHKRLIIHFMQPHTPWLGETADKIRDEYNVTGNNKNHGKKMLGYDVQDPTTGNVGWFNLIRQGHISRSTAYEAYSETLDIALDYVVEMINELSGKTVITADHGEMLGEKIGMKRWYGHPENFWTKNLRIVPWLEVDNNNRRTITQENPKQRNRMDSDIVERRLKQLGYQS